jgi:uncharacterized protein (TIGR02284 family)
MKTENMEHAAEVLNDLLRINNDRVEGYKKAIEETKEQDLISLFDRMQAESGRIANSLIKEIARLGGEPDAGKTTNPGKIYRVWMEVKATFNGKDRKGVLNACEFGEDAAQSAYKTALADKEIPETLRAVIRTQQVQLKASHNAIRGLRDLAVA